MSSFNVCLEAPQVFCGVGSQVFNLFCMRTPMSKAEPSENHNSDLVLHDYDFSKFAQLVWPWEPLRKTSQKMFYVDVKEQVACLDFLTLAPRFLL